MERRAAPRDPPNADYDALFELSQVPTLEIDGVGTVVRINPAAAQLLDATPDAAHGRSLDELLDVDVTVPLSSREGATITITTVDGPAEVVFRSMRRALRSGTGHRFTVQLAPTRRDDDHDAVRRGDPLHWSAMDVVGHNLGTPLSIVGGYAETLLTHAQRMSPEGIADAAAAMHRHAARAIDELHALLARVRLDAGGTDTVPTSVLLAWLRRILDANLVASNTALVAGGLVEVVTLDVTVARQALLNACTIALHAEPRPQVLELTVRSVDEGTLFVLGANGWSDQVRLHDDAAFTIEVTRSLVAAHGGRYDPPTADDPTQRIVLPPRSGMARPPSLPTISVAVIDDDPDAAVLIRTALRGSVFEMVADERTFAAGLAAIEHAQPRIVLLDQHLPDRTGTDGLDEVRAAAPGARIVVLSARGPSDRDELDDDTVWLEKGRVLADLGSELISVLASTQ